MLVILFGQANSPIRTLDELHVSEVVPSPYFPSTAERGQTNSLEQAAVESSNASQIKPDVNGSGNNCDKVAASSTANGQAFGQRRSHCCYVITARARSFLYHQVSCTCSIVKCFPQSIIVTNQTITHIWNLSSVPYNADYFLDAILTCWVFFCFIPRHDNNCAFSGSAACWCSEMCWHWRINNYWWYGFIVYFCSALSITC